MKALILAAGAGSRLHPFTAELPKPMLPVAGRPLLERTVEGLRRQGITELAINLHHHPEAVREHFGDGRRFGVRITYSQERTLLGTAGAAKALEGFLDETFLVVYGDVLTDMSCARLLEFHRERSSALTLALYRVEDPTAAGLVETDAAGRVTRFVEKPPAAEVFTDLANAGVLVCEPRLLGMLGEQRPLDFGADLLPRLLAGREPVFGLPLAPGEYLIDIGTPASFLRAQVEWQALEEGRRPARARRVEPADPQLVARAPAFVDDYLERLARTLRETSRDAVVEVVGLLLEAWRRGRKVLVLGNGGSAATASHTVNDLSKLTLCPGWPRLRALALNDNVPLLTAWANDASYEDSFAEPLATLVDPGDLVLAISTSGNSPNVLRAVEVARRMGAVTVGFTGRTGGRLVELVDRAVRVPSDHIGRQEDVHQALEHAIAVTLRELAADDSASAWTLVDDYLTRLERVVRELPRPAIVDALSLVLEAWRGERKVLVLGNGGSAATASHTVNDLSKLTLTPGWPRLRALALNDNVPLLTAWSNDASYEVSFAEPLATLVDPGDLVIAISTSGNSPNVLRAVELAKRAGAATLGFTGRTGGRLAELVDRAVRVPSDHIGRQEDAHLVLDHVISCALREIAAGRGASARSAA